MSDKEYCDEENCAACDLKRHMNHILESGCPPELLLTIVTRALAEVVSDTINVQVVEMTTDEMRAAAETVH